jgi:thymidylate synthase/dihydrofolate reductase
MGVNVILSASLQKDGTLGIGKSGYLPWFVSDDLKFFKNKTRKCTVVMGRKTYESIGHPLEDRKNIVLSKTKKFPGTFSITCITDLDEYISNNSNEEIFIIGGKELYDTYTKTASKIFLTHILDYHRCDTTVNCISDEYTIFDYSEVFFNSVVKYRFIEFRRFKTSQESVYFSLVKQILDKGIFKEDRTDTGTLSVFGTQHRYDISNGKIPLLTTKKIPFNSVIEELLWFCRGETDAKILDIRGVKIWNANTTDNFLNSRNLNYIAGQAGPIYGWQWRKFNASFPDGEHGVDQLKKVEFLLKTDPFSRRIMLSSWNPNQLDEMVLPPCHFCVMFYVEAKDNELYLSSHYIMRSNDVILGNPWNIVCYSVLTQILAKKHGMIAKELVATVNDAHIYTNHLETAEKQLKVPVRSPPLLELSDSVATKEWEELTVDDFDLIGYLPAPSLKCKMAV